MNNSTHTRPVNVEKEAISGLKFPENDVLKTAEEIKNRAINLERALKLGNLEHNKIEIIFEDSEGIKMVNTTVWGVTDKRIILKQGIVMPIHRIISVNA